MEMTPPLRGEPILGKPFGEGQTEPDPKGKPINDPIERPIGRPVEKPIVAHPIVGKPVGGGPVEAKPVEGKPVEAHPVEKTPITAKPIKAHPVEGKPIEAKPVEGKPVEAHPVSGTPLKGRPVESKPVQAQPPIPANPITPAVVVATIAGLIAGRAYNSGSKNPTITAQQVHDILVSASFANSAKTLSVETMSQAISLLGSPKSAIVIANAKAVALQVVRARLTVSKELSAAPSPTSTHAPVANPIHTTPVHEPVVIHEPVHAGKGGPNLV